MSLFLLPSDGTDSVWILYFSPTLTQTKKMRFWETDTVLQPEIFGPGSTELYHRHQNWWVIPASCCWQRDFRNLHAPNGQISWCHLTLCCAGKNRSVCHTFWFGGDVKKGRLKLCLQQYVHRVRAVILTWRSVFWSKWFWCQQSSQVFSPWSLFCQCFPQENLCPLTRRGLKMQMMITGEYVGGTMGNHVQGDDVNKRPNCSTTSRQCALRLWRVDKYRPKRFSDPRTANWVWSGDPRNQSESSEWLSSVLSDVPSALLKPAGRCLQVHLGFLHVWMVFMTSRCKHQILSPVQKQKQGCVNSLIFKVPLWKYFFFLMHVLVSFFWY